MGGSWVDWLCPTVLIMDYVLVPSPKRKVKILGHDLYDLSNDIDYEFWVRTSSWGYVDMTPFKEDILHIKTSMDCYYLIDLYYAVIYNDTIENCERCIDLMKNKECISLAMKILNEYNRIDLIAILLDKKKDIVKSGDFEL